MNKEGEKGRRKRRKPSWVFVNIFVLIPMSSATLWINGSHGFSTNSHFPSRDFLHLFNSALEAATAYYFLNFYAAFNSFLEAHSQNPSTSMTSHLRGNFLYMEISSENNECLASPLEVE